MILFPAPRNEHGITATDQVPVGALVSGCDVAVDLQSRLVVHVRLPVPLHRLGRRRTAKQRLHVKRLQLQRPDTHTQCKLDILSDDPRQAGSQTVTSAV